MTLPITIFILLLTATTACEIAPESNYCADCGKDAISGDAKVDANSADACCLEDSGNNTSPDSTTPGTCKPCTESNPICNPATLQCVQCLTNVDCSEAKPICASDNSCVQCEKNEDCLTNQCVDRICTGCTDDNQCPGGVCSSSASCVQCETNQDCAGNATGAICHEAQCVQCANNSDCPDGVCSDTKTCIECQTSNDCDAPNPACNPATHKCVPCIEQDDEGCEGATPYCKKATKPEENQCVECLHMSHCEDNEDGEVCDIDSNICVECVTDDSCPSESEPYCKDNTCQGCESDNPCLRFSDTPACKTSTGSCVECTASNDSHCEDDTPRCDESTNQCVQCTENAHCTDPTASRCNGSNKTCEACRNNTDCSHVSGLTVCDGSVTPHECVQCTGTQYSACGIDTETTGKPFVCDSLAKTCTQETEGDALTCEPCVSDAHCGSELLCMPMTFGAGDTAVGTFCLWPKEATGVGAPNNSCLNVPPYITTETDWTSLDGNLPTEVCKPRETTCQGLNDFSDFENPCSGANATGHAQCGAPGLDDAYCAPLDDQYLCTVPCTSSYDCENEWPCEQQDLGTGIVKVCAFEE